MRGFPVEVIDPEVVYVKPHGAVEAGTRHGVAAFRRAVEKVFEGWATWATQPEQLVAVGNQIAAVVRYRARGRTSGVRARGTRVRQRQGLHSVLLSRALPHATRWLG